MKNTEHPYEYTLRHTAYLTDKQAKLVQEAKEKNKKYRIVTTAPRISDNHIKDKSITELMYIDDILQQWFYAVYNIKETHRGIKSALLIENINDMFFMLLVDKNTGEVVIEYMLEGEGTCDM